MANKLLGDWRLRILDSNGDPFSVAARISFYKSDLTTDKDVYADIASAVSLGSIVDLDAEGYVPVSGIWLGDGAYSAIVEKYSYTTILGVDVYETEYSIPYITGSDDGLTSAGSTLTYYPTVSAMVASSTQTDSICAGYYDSTDGGGGLFKWDDSSTDTQDNGAILESTGLLIGRYVRLFNDKSNINIRMWGATESIVNSKLFISNAISYCTLNKYNCRLVSGTYQLAAEPLDISELCIVEDNFYLEGNGLVTITNADIRTDKSLVENIDLLAIEARYIKPEWFSVANVVTTDGIKAAYDNAEIYKSCVLFTDTDGYTFTGNSEAINETGIASTAFGPATSMTITGLAYNFSFGDITMNEWDGTDCIEAASYEYLVPHGKMYERWFNGLTGDDFSSLMNSRSYNVTFVWTSKFTFETSYTEISNVTHVFEDNASWQLTAACSFSINELDIKRLFDLASLSYLLGTVKIFNSGEDAIELTTNLSLIADDIIFTGCRFTIDGDISVTFSGYGKFNDCVFSKTNTADSLTISSIGQLYVYKCRSLLETAFSGNYITAENNTFEKVTLNGSAAAVLKTMWFYNNIFRDTVTLLSNATNTIVTNVKITNNTFALELASTRILTSGSFMNAQKTHFVVIKDNLASTNDEQTYVPMTQGIYLYRRNEMPTTELVVTPDETIFDITLDVYDDVKYSALAVLKRQIFALAGDNDINWFSKFKFYNCYVDCYVGTTLTYTYDMYFQTKKMTIAHLKTGGHFDVDRLPVSDATTILPYGDGIYLVGTVDFSIYDELTYDYKLTPHLLP